MRFKLPRSKLMQRCTFLGNIQDNIREYLEPSQTIVVYLYNRGFQIIVYYLNFLDLLQVDGTHSHKPDISHVYHFCITQYSTK